jgi:hypothetical protein
MERQARRQSRGAAANAQPFEKIAAIHLRSFFSGLVSHDGDSSRVGSKVQGSKFNSTLELLND